MIGFVMGNSHVPLPTPKIKLSVCGTDTVLRKAKTRQLAAPGFVDQPSAIAKEEGQDSLYGGLGNL